MDRDVIEQKLESLRRCLKRVADKCPADPAALAADPDLQDIVALNLTRAVQLCVDIGAHLIAELDLSPPGTMAQTFDSLQQAGVLEATLAQSLRKAVGFRNVAVHNYEAIDWTIVHAIAQHHLSDFSAFARDIALRLK